MERQETQPVKSLLQIFLEHSRISEDEYPGIVEKLVAAERGEGLLEGETPADAFYRVLESDEYAQQNSREAQRRRLNERLTEGRDYLRASIRASIGEVLVGETPKEQEVLDRISLLAQMSNIAADLNFALGHIKNTDEYLMRIDKDSLEVLISQFKELLNKLKKVVEPATPPPEPRENVESLFLLARAAIRHTRRKS